MTAGRSGHEDTLALSIGQMLDELPRGRQNPSIRRVDDLLRRTNEPAYEPRIVSIGPYHRGKEGLHSMEQEKKKYLKELLQSEGRSCVDTYVQKIRGLKDRARRCYSEHIDLGDDEFVEMLLLDAVFILQFLRRYLDVFSPTESPKAVASLATSGDAIFEFGHVIAHVLHDLVLLENQIPFFVIEEMYKLTKAHGPENIGLLITPLAPNAIEACKLVRTDGADHLLAMVHRAICYSFDKKHNARCRENINEEFQNINSATELTEGGICFKRVKCDHTISTSWLDIQFKHKKIHIPVLEVSDVTESRFRNMIAYEYYLPRKDPKYVTDYIFFMHCLIRATKDAQLLRRCGVISNWLGGDEMVYHLVNQMGTNVLTSEKFSYLEVFNDVHRHCKSRRNRWLAILRRDYFNCPWKRWGYRIQAQEDSQTGLGSLGCDRVQVQKHDRVLVLPPAQGSKVHNRLYIVHALLDTRRRTLRF